MHIESLHLINFRNHRKLSMDFKNEINLIIGRNGAGKTNILEAINMFSLGHSFRARNESELLHNEILTDTKAQATEVFDGSATTFGDFAYLKIIGHNDNSNFTAELSLSKPLTSEALVGKIAKLNGLKKSIYSLSETFKVTLFAPQDLELLTAPPASRRRYLDNLISQTSTLYKKHLTTYLKALRNRNKVLEKIALFHSSKEEISFWTDKLLESGSYVQSARKEYISTIQEPLRRSFKEIDSRNLDIELKYLQNQLTPARLDDYYTKDLSAKTTLIGPHRDDFEISANNKNVAYFTSRGEQRTMLLALKMAEFALLEREKQKPLVLLDDIFSELDINHQHKILELLHNKQSIITSTTDLQFLPGHRIYLE